MSATQPLDVTLQRERVDVAGRDDHRLLPGASAGPGATVTNTYATAGTYNVVLTVTDSRGQTASSEATITVDGSGPTGTPPPTCPTVDFT